VSDTPDTPEVELEPFTLPELHERVRGGEVESDLLEALLVASGRGRGVFDLLVGEGLARLEGEREATWVERASKETVRALHAAVAAERKAVAEAESEWVRLSVRMRPEERAVVDEALQVADKLSPGRSRGQRLEAMAQEVIGMVAAVVEDPERVRLGNAFRVPRPKPDTSARDEAMENDNERWSHMAPVPALSLPDVDFRTMTSAEEIDRELRKLMKERDLRDHYLGFAAATLQDARLFETLGYSGFRQYCEERLGLSARTVEERARLERALGSRRALRDARKAGLSYAKLKLLARLPDRLVREWIGKAMGMTCIDLARKLESDRDRKMRAQHRLEAPMEKGAALTLAAAIGAVRKLCDMVVSDGKCLAILAQHFLDTYRAQVKPPTGGAAAPQSYFHPPDPAPSRLHS
jgi:hypothetical protein